MFYSSWNTATVHTFYPLIVTFSVSEMSVKYMLAPLLIYGIAAINRHSIIIIEIAAHYCKTIKCKTPEDFPMAEKVTCLTQIGTKWARWCSD